MDAKDQAFANAYRETGDLEGSYLAAYPQANRGGTPIAERAMDKLRSRDVSVYLASSEPTIDAESVGRKEVKQQFVHMLEATATDVLDPDGKLMPRNLWPTRAKYGVKKVTSLDGNVTVEMVDKVRVTDLLAKAAGAYEEQEDARDPVRGWLANFTKEDLAYIEEACELELKSRAEAGDREAAQLLEEGSGTQEDATDGDPAATAG